MNEEVNEELELVEGLEDDEAEEEEMSGIDIWSFVIYLIL